MNSGHQNRGAVSVGDVHRRARRNQRFHPNEKTELGGYVELGFANAVAEVQLDTLCVDEKIVDPRIHIRIMRFSTKVKIDSLL